MTQIAIAGAGIAGLSCAIALQNMGYTVTVFEAAPAIKPIGAGLSLAANAIKAFDYLGIRENIINAGHALPFFNIYTQNGNMLMSTNSGSVSSRFGIDNFLIHRSEVHKILLHKVGTNNCCTNKKIAHFKQEQNKVTLFFEDGSKYECNYLIAADGINSVIRKQLLPQSQIRYSGYTCWRAVIDNTSININEVFETWGKTGRFGLAQLANSQLYWYACMNAPQNSHLRHLTINDLQQHFAPFHQPIPQVLTHTKTEQLIWNDIVDLKPITQYAFDKILLVGDAAHATTPNMGQGACQAIEDAATLQQCLTKEINLNKAFQQFEKLRLHRTHYVVNRSRKMGQLAQLTNPLAIAARNTFVKLIPASIREKQFQKLYDISFS